MKETVIKEKRIDILGFFRDFFATEIIENNNDEEELLKWKKENNISDKNIERLEKAMIYADKKTKRAKKEITLNETPNKGETKIIEKTKGEREIGE